MAKRNAKEIVAPESTERLRKTILDYLAAHNAMTIASCDKNVPWAAAVFYASEELDLYFISNPRSDRKSVV